MMTCNQEDMGSIMMRWVLLILAGLASSAAAAGQNPLSPPTPSDPVTANPLSETVVVSPTAVTDTLSFNFDATTEGWGFTLPANVLQENYPDPLRGCQEFSRNVVLVGVEHTLGWNSFGGVGALSWSCPFYGWNTNACNYSFRMKSINVPVPIAWEGAYKFEARLNNASNQRIYAMIGYKMWGDTIFSYTGWSPFLPTNAWEVVSRTIPSTMTFRNLEAISILLGSSGTIGTVYVDWVKGYKPAAPMAVSPANGATIENNRPLIQWSATADSYDWEYSANTDFKPSTVISNIPSNQYSVPVGLPNGLYYWRVRAYTTIGDGHSNYSKTSSFTIVGDLNVPEEFPSISVALAAIPTFGSGTIVVAPGIYPANGNINLSAPEKGVTIKSSGGPESTVIDCGFNETFFTFDLYTTAGVIIDGFTILNTKGEAIRCISTTGNVRNCIIRSNGSSAGLYVINGGSMNVSNCRIENNGYGGLMCVNAKNVTVVNSVFSHNRGGYGGAIYSQYSTLSLTGCTLDSNSSSIVGGIYADSTNLAIVGSSFVRNVSSENVSAIILNRSKTTIQNSLFALGAGFGVITSDAVSIPQLSCCDIYGNNGGDWSGIISSQATMNGNFSLDPLFCDTMKIDSQQVVANSPCLAASNGCGVQIGTVLPGCLAMAMKTTPDSLTFLAVTGQPDPAPQTLSILNLGGSVLKWSALTHRSGWLSLSAQSGAAPSTDTVSARAVSLSPGIYYDTVEVTATGTLLPLVKVPVRLRVVLPNRPPVLTRISPQTVREGETLAVHIVASDSDKTIPKLSVVGLPTNGTFTDSLNGSGAFVFRPDFTQAGQYGVKILATDAVEPSLVDSTNLALTVVNVNRPPSFTHMSANIEMFEGDSCRLYAFAADPDGDPLRITCTGLPPQALFTDSGNGWASVTFVSDHTNAGQTYHVQFSVTDNHSTPATATTIIQVKVIQLEVVKFTPDIKTGDNDVLVTSNIEIVFNKDIDLQTLAGNLTIRSARGDAFTYTYDPGGRRIVIDKGRPLLTPLDTITVRLLPDLQDLSGHRLGTLFERIILTGTVVYAGDATNDGVVDERDILPIGFFWGQTGPTREGYPNLSWTASPGHQWSPVAASFADADGSGVIDAKDICAVINNWEKHVSGISAPKVPITSGSIERALGDRDRSVLAAMYEGVTTCPEGAAKQLILRALNELLKRESEAALPTSLALHQNFPNPFNPSTEISFDLPYSCSVTMEIFSSTGGVVSVPVRGSFPAGTHTIRWDGIDADGHHAASGVYLYRLTAGDFVQTKKMLLLK